MAMTKHEQLLRIRDEYRKANGDVPATSREMADWAVKQGKYKLPEYAAAAKCAEELSEAMRTDFTMDAHGNRVRVMHAATRPQGTLWDHIATASREHMELSTAQRRNGIVGEVKQLKTDIDYFNQLHRDEEPLQCSFNFTNDLADAGLLGDAPTVPDLRLPQSQVTLAVPPSVRLPSRPSNRPATHP